jgi:hypothetical protein
MPDIYRAKEAFSLPSHRVIVPGDLLSSDDPDFKGREHLFEPVAAAAARVMDNVATETATTAPGERRVRSKRFEDKHDEDSKEG